MHATRRQGNFYIPKVIIMNFFYQALGIIKERNIWLGMHHLFALLELLLCRGSDLLDFGSVWYSSLSITVVFFHFLNVLSWETDE
jgi:hypothetical protein